MTATEMAKLIKRTGSYWVLDMKIAIRVVDARMRFGDLDVRIAPIAGEGSTWVRRDSIQLDEES